MQWVFRNLQINTILLSVTLFVKKMKDFHYLQILLFVVADPRPKTDGKIRTKLVSTDEHAKHPEKIASK